MWQSGAPADPVRWLAAHGWLAELFDPAERAATYGRPGLFDGLRLSTRHPLADQRHPQLARERVVANGQRVEAPRPQHQRR
jgi:hypothetical protein